MILEEVIEVRLFHNAGEELPAGVEDVAAFHAFHFRRADVSVPQRGDDALIGVFDVGDLQYVDTEITEVELGFPVLHISAEDDFVSDAVDGEIPRVVAERLIEQDDGEFTVEILGKIDRTADGKADLEGVFLKHTAAKPDDGGLEEAPEYAVHTFRGAGLFFLHVKHIERHFLHVALEAEGRHVRSGFGLAGSQAEQRRKG